MIVYSLHVRDLPLLPVRLGTNRIPFDAANHMPASDPTTNQQAHWAMSLRVVLLILSFWFLVSLGCGVLFRDFLDANMPSIGGAPFGFWMAQQGAILGFLGLLVMYMVLMNKIDETYGYDEGADA